ncbi:MAG TPA: PfkB family carbohydrate kinase [Gemmataceae bacterium]|nr:PfkB family carbohydrate kinase [Gemmataceae bacterium]
MNNRGRDEKHRDLLGIGALNVDYIATRERLLRIDPGTRSEFSDRFEHGTERPVDEEEINLTLAQMGAPAFEIHLGGSSFNAIHALASLRPGLRLGFIGVAGHSGQEGAPSFEDWFANHRVDDRFVSREPESRAGTCISYINEGERSMLTCPGVNVLMGQFLSDQFEAVRDYVAHSRMVHITSFFDDVTPGVLARLLQEAKRINPWLRISFDPGHHWVAHKRREIQPILKCTDYLFLNDREFKILGHHRPGVFDKQVAGFIFNQCSGTSVLLVLKRYDHIALFTRLDGRILEHRYANVVLTPDQIEDATGAGDVFAAGFAAGMLIPGLELKHGINLGLRLVRAKLLTGGTSAFHTFPAILRDFLDDVTAQPQGGIPAVQSSQASERNSVYIGFGQDPLGNQVEEYLRRTHGLDVKRCALKPRAGRQHVDDLSDCLDCCTFAVLVPDPEGEAEDDKPWTRDRVLREAGLFQGRLGLHRVVLMLPEGVKKLANVEGLQSIDVPKDRLYRALKQLEVLLKRDGIIPSKGEGGPEASEDVAVSPGDPRLMSGIREVVIGIGENCYKLTAERVPPFSLSPDLTHMFSFFARKVAVNAAQEVVTWGPLNSAIEGTTDNIDVLRSGPSLRKALSELNNRLQGEWGAPPDGQAWIISKRKQGAYLNLSVQWSVTDDLKRDLTGTNLSVFGLSTRPHTLEENTPLREQRLPSRSRRAGSRDHDEEDDA